MYAVYLASIIFSQGICLCTDRYRVHEMVLKSSSACSLEYYTQCLVIIDCIVYMYVYTVFTGVVAMATTY